MIYINVLIDFILSHHSISKVSQLMLATLTGYLVQIVSVCVIVSPFVSQSDKMTVSNCDHQWQYLTGSQRKVLNLSSIVLWDTSRVHQYAITLYRSSKVAFFMIVSKIS